METLPGHILIEIFEYLNCLEIMKALRVCKRWNKLIVTSSRILQKFTCNWDIFYKFSYYDEDPTVLVRNFEEFEGKLMKFPFKNVTICDTLIPLNLWERFVEILQKHSTKVEKLKIARPNGTVILPILRATSTNLVELIVSTNSDVKIDELESVYLPKLKVLKLHQTTSVLSKIYAENLTKLEITDCVDENGHVEKFFMRAKNLKSIIFTNGVPQNFSRYNQMPFELENFEVQTRQIRMPENLLEFLINFLKSQAQNLKKLKIRHNLDCKKILNIAIGRMKLEILDCSGRIEIHQGMEILNNIPENSTIKDLYIQFNTFKSNSIVRADNMDIELGIIKKCKTLEKLKLDYISGELEDFIKEIQSCNFTILNIRFSVSPKATDLKYEKIKVLNTIRISYETEIFFNFIASFSNIKKIYIERIEVPIIPENFHKIFRTCQKLEEIEINYFNNNLDNLYDMFNSQDCQIKMLKVGANLTYGVRLIEEKFKNVPFEVKVQSYYGHPMSRLEFDGDFSKYSRVKDEDF